MSTPRFKPSVTVAAVIEHEQRPGHFLLVEEYTPEGLRLNNPAGHLEQGESPLDAVVREVLEETGCRFEPQAFVGTYLARFQRRLLSTDPAEVLAEDVTYVRLAYSGRVGAPLAEHALDEGIVRTVWMPVDDIRKHTNQLRSPLVMACIDDYLRGRRHALELVTTHASVFEPIRLSTTGLP